jgi:hypothetical protein
MARRGGVFLTLWLAAHQAIISEAATSLLLAYSIHRHGARNQLPKSIFLQESTALDGTTLLPQGQRLCYNAGVLAMDDQPFPRHPKPIILLGSSRHSLQLRIDVQAGHTERGT